ncbi:MAG: GlmU family protein [Vicingaceae bacterium]
MHLVFSDFNYHHKLLPLTFIKPVAKLRVGILTIEEKWIKRFKQNNIEVSIYYNTPEYLKDLFRSANQQLHDFYLINSSFLPSDDFFNAAMQLSLGEGIYHNDELIIGRVSNLHEKPKSIDQSIPVHQIKNPRDIFLLNGNEIANDFNLLTKNKTSNSICTTNTIIGDHPVFDHGNLIEHNIFIEEGAKVTASVLNASSGPIYIGKNTEIMEGALIRGPFALCEGGVVKMGAKIYGPTTIGPYCKVGGEVNNTVFQNYSNKGHDGFLGNSVIGDWCNLGADTNTSNLKNNYGTVKVWDYETENYINSGLQFCGLIMGDHSKSSINSMFNTGTTVGFSANIFGSGFPKKFIPSFSWGEQHTFEIEKSIEVASRMMERRGKSLSAEEIKVFHQIFNYTSKYRS